MCSFFSLVTSPDLFPNKKFYLNWEFRRDNPFENPDSHSIICRTFSLPEDRSNKYEYNPLTGKFKADGINADVDDSLQVESWCKVLDFKTVNPYLIVKPVVNVATLPEVIEITKEHLKLLEDWKKAYTAFCSSLEFAATSDAVFSKTFRLVQDSKKDSRWCTVWNLIQETVSEEVNYSARHLPDVLRSAFLRAKYFYCTSFFDIEYGYNFSPVVKLWEAGLFTYFDGRVWRIYSGKNTKLLYKQR